MSLDWTIVFVTQLHSLRQKGGASVSEENLHSGMMVNLLLFAVRFPSVLECQF